MAKNRNLHYAVRCALVAVAAASAPSAYAQTAPASTTPAVLEDIVVTGSRIKTTNELSISPVTSVTAADIQNTGLTHVEDVLNNLPQVFASQGSTYSNGSDGTATINLRGLGANRTLVLVNGRRLGPGSADGRNYSDVNQVPAALIEKIDVLTGGASATYGADAVAGVVNFILNTHFEGVKIDASYSMFQHHNQNGIDKTVTAAGDPLPPSHVNTGAGKDLSILMGSNFADGKGNATFYATYTSAAAVLQSQYDYSACSLGAPKKSAVLNGTGKISCGGSGTSAGGYFQAYGNSGAALFTNTVDRSTGAFRAFNFGPGQNDLFNYGPLNYFKRPSERYTAGTFVNYTVNSSLNTYAEFMFSRNTSVAQIAPSGDFFLLSHISCANPLLTVGEKAVICNPANLAAQGYSDGLDVYIGRRNIEGGGRQESFANDAYRTIIGARGDFGGAWSYDVYGQYGTTQINNQNLNYLSNTYIQRALNVVTNPATGQPVCASVLDRSDKTCVPWNIWVPGAVTKAATNYLSIPLQIQGDVTEQVVSGSISGDLTKYGVKVPSAATGLGVVLGAEWREDTSHFNPDLASQQGIAAGSGGKTNAVAGSFHVGELFTELRVPIADHQPFAESLALETAYRYSNYSLGFKTNTYKLGLEWSPVRDLRVRASYQRAVRAPNVGELYSPQSVALDGSTDPCSGSSPAFSAPLCANSGVTAPQYGNIAPNPANQYNGLTGGNPTLLPEKADTYAIGVMFQPHVVANLTLSVDYFDIKVKKVIGGVGADVILQNCITTGSPSFCSLVNRAAGTGSLWKSNNGYIVDTNVNFGELATKGIDFTGNYRMPMGGYGSMVFQFNGTKLSTLSTTPVEGRASYDCIGWSGAKCGNPSPAWRHTLNSTWKTPWHAMDLSLRWRYFGKVENELNSSNPILKGTAFPATAKLKAYNYIDLVAAMAATDNVTLRLGINNLFDRDPPIIPNGTTSACPSGPCNGNTWAQTYDSLGRYMYIHATLQF